MADLVRRAAGTEISRARWEKTLKEAPYWLPSIPTPLTSDSIDAIPLSPRFAIHEHHGGRETKIRVIGGLIATQVNDFLGLVATSMPRRFDLFLSMMPARAQIGSGDALQAFSLDFAHAYNHVGVASDQIGFSAEVLGAPDGTQRMDTLKTQPFGGGRAPANRARVDAYIQLVLLHRCDIWKGLRGTRRGDLARVPHGQGPLRPVWPAVGTEQTGRALSVALAPGCEGFVLVRRCACFPTCAAAA